MTTLFAQPYDISASGFYFESAADYESKVAKAINAYGQTVEEFEIQFIDGEGIDAELFSAISVHQGDVAAFFAAIDGWSDNEKIKTIIAVGEAGYSFNLATDGPDRFEIDLYECDTMRDLAIQFVDESLFGDIPERIQFYLDYDAIARDLSVDYALTVIEGTTYIYRCM